MNRQELVNYILLNSKYSIDEISSKIDVDRSNLYLWKKGKSKPKVGNINKMAAITGHEIKWLNEDEIEVKSNQVFNSLNTLGLRVKLDDRENISLGYKLNDSEVKGIPMRIIIGQKELENSKADIFFRHDMSKFEVSFDEIPKKVLESIEIIQNKMIRNQIKD